MWLFFRADSIGQAWGLLVRAIKMETLTISQDLLNCFVLPEIEWLIEGIRLLEDYVSKINGFYMWIFLFAALGICLNEPNINERKFRPTPIVAVRISLLLIWSIISFSGVSVFLYFNF